MSTRSVIIITGSERYNVSKTIRLYKHSDGYPSGNLPIILKSIKQCLELIKKENERWKNDAISKPHALNPGMLTGAIIGEATSVYGMGAYVEEEYQETFQPKHLGNQWDVEWIYLLNTDNSTLNIYRGSFKDGIQAGYKKGTVDPSTYGKQLYPEYQDKTRSYINKTIEQIEAIGFKVNQKPTRKPRSKVNKAKAQLGVA